MSSASSNKAHTRGRLVSDDRRIHSQRATRIVPSVRHRLRLLRRIIKQRNLKPQQTPSNKRTDIRVSKEACAAFTPPESTFRWYCMISLAAALSLVLCHGGLGSSDVLLREKAKVNGKITFRLKIEAQLNVLNLRRDNSVILPRRQGSSRTNRDLGNDDNDREIVSPFCPHPATV